MGSQKRSFNQKMSSLSTSLVARPTTTTVSLRKNTNTKVNSTKVALKTAQLQRRKQRVDKRGVHIIAMAGKPERGSRPSAEVIAANPNAVVDGKLWVCQGCGYVYDGTKGPWAEEKRCPACGERRFALKSRDEMAVAIGGLIVSVLLFGLLFVIVK